MFLLAEVTGGSALELFSNNLINWLVLLAFLVWLWMKYMPKAFSGREQSINAALANAKQMRQQGDVFLAEQKAKLAQAEKEADKIVAEAKQVAEQMKMQIEEQTKVDLGELTERIEHEIKNQRQIAIVELRAASAKAAIQLSEEILPQLITAGERKHLVNQFVEQIDSLN